MSKKRRVKRRGPSAEERRRRELKSYLDQLRRIKQPTQRDIDLMGELRQALIDLKNPLKQR